MMSAPKPLNPGVLALLANPAYRAEEFATGAAATYARIPKVDWEGYKKERARMGRDCGPGYRWVPDLPGLPAEVAREGASEVRWQGILMHTALPPSLLPSSALQRRPNVPRGFPRTNTPVTNIGARRAQYARETVAAINGFALLSALEPQTEADLRTLVASLDAAAKKVEAVKPGLLSTLWQDIVGSDPTGAAVRSTAHAQRVLAETIAAKAAAIAKAGDETAAKKLLQDAARGNWTDVAATLETARLASASGGAAEIGTGIAKDAATLAAETGKGWATVVKLTPYIAVGLLGLMAWQFAKRAGSGAGDALRIAAQNVTIPTSQPVSGLGRRRRSRRRR